ncbi:MAG TPA: hypothetical protein VFW07_04505 [Parafilimonas sp.]|nr:hypothetical protein [Parafilimonas sp.]
MTPNNQQVDAEFLMKIKTRLKKMKATANWVGGLLIALGALAIVSSLFITAFADTVDILAIKIVAFASTLFITLIGAFNLPSKANDTRNGWKHLNNAVIQFEASVIDAKTLIKAYEDSENMLGTIIFNFVDKGNPTTHNKSILAASGADTAQQQQ